jgi:phosphoribosyl 1,2-cyclic phosphate phosphodiesterase
MDITFLGTGTSQGVPIIGCKCSVCQSENPKDKRLRSSVHIEVDGLSLLVDSGPDFRQQMLREGIIRLDAILFTHDHKDHTAGLDDVRAFNFLQKKPMEVYGEDYVLETLRREFSYVFAKKKYPGVPKINLNKISNRKFKIRNQIIEPIRGLHFRLPVLGFKINNFAYITDMNFISDEEIQKIKGIDILVINALRLEKHISHFNLEEALSVIEKSNVKHAYLTHISHALGSYDNLSAKLPSNVSLAYDGLKIKS